jgi:hypothetical protein
MRSAWAPARTSYPYRWRPIPFEILRSDDPSAYTVHEPAAMYNPNTKFHGVLAHEEQLLSSPAVVCFGVDNSNTAN